MPPFRVFRSGALIALLAGAWMLPTFPALGEDGVYFGYVEGDFTYIAPERAGRLTDVFAEEGREVDRGDALFEQESERERLGLNAAQARLQAERARLADMRQGRRAAELAVIEEQLKSARTALELANTTYQRTKQLRERDAVPASQLDQDRAGLQSAEARVRQLTAELEAARLPARTDQIAAQEGVVDAAQAEVDRARLDLTERTVQAPAPARVERVFLKAGEIAGAGQAVVRLLEPGRVTFRFYVPAGERTALAPGTRVRVDCEGCPAPIDARITRLSQDAQFTPPFIYSLNERSKLVFLAEATPESPSNLPVGQPIDVRLGTAEKGSASGGE